MDYARKNIKILVNPSCRLKGLAVITNMANINTITSKKQRALPVFLQHRKKQQLCELIVVLKGSLHREFFSQGSPAFDKADNF